MLPADYQKNTDLVSLNEISSFCPNIRGMLFLPFADENYP